MQEKLMDQLVSNIMTLVKHIAHCILPKYIVYSFINSVFRLIFSKVSNTADVLIVYSTNKNQKCTKFISLFRGLLHQFCSETRLK